MIQKSEKPAEKNSETARAKPLEAVKFEAPTVALNESKKELQNAFQSDPRSYNGAMRDKYAWTQSIKDIDVQVKVKLLTDMVFKKKK